MTHISSHDRGQHLIGRREDSNAYCFKQRLLTVSHLKIILTIGKAYKIL